MTEQSRSIGLRVGNFSFFSFWLVVLATRKRFCVCLLINLFTGMSIPIFVFLLKLLKSLVEDSVPADHQFACELCLSLKQVIYRLIFPAVVCPISFFKSWGHILLFYVTLSIVQGDLQSFILLALLKSIL